ncbi:MAG: Na+/H+ antiporter subunit E [Exilibacterium sp.]
MRHTFSLSALLSLLWLLNSGHYTPTLLAFGVASIALVVWLSYRMAIVDSESLPFHLILRLPPYYGWLIKKLIYSNIDVVTRIWRGNKSITPCVATLDIDQHTDMGRVIYANSITLTPGTITLDLTDTSVTVHSLTKNGLDELIQGEMNNRVSALEQ